MTFELSPFEYAVLFAIANGAKGCQSIAESVGKSRETVRRTLSIMRYRRKSQLRDAVAARSNDE